MRRLTMSLLVAGLAFASPAGALTDEEVFRDFRFNLINPGARARGLAGAFVSLADDATAAQANPAGLSFLLRSEFFAEMRMVDHGARAAVREETLPTGIDTFVATATDLQDDVSLSFLSAVVVFDRWTLGLSRQNLINIDNSTLSTFAFTFDDTTGAFIAEGSGAINVGVVNWNVSAGVRVTEKLSLGATLAYSRLEVTSLVANTIVDTGAIVAPEEILEPSLDVATAIDDTDDDLIFSLGLLYRVPGRWSAGAVYRRGPRFSVDEHVLTAPDDGGATTGTDLFGVAQRLGTQFENAFNLPDTFAFGGNWLPLKSQRLTLALDIERILYSNLVNEYLPGVNILTSSDAQFAIDDATDVRLGAEYLFPGAGNTLTSWALRGGVFTEDASTISAQSTGEDAFATEEVFRSAGRQEHVTLGIGVVLGHSYKLDAAADFADTDNEYLLSFTYQSKK